MKTDFGHHTLPFSHTVPLSLALATRARQGLGPAVLRALPELPLGRALSHHKQEGGCFYVNNAEPWNAIKYLRYHGTN